MVLRRSLAAAVDALSLLGVILCIPFVIIAVGLPVVLVVEALRQIGRLF